MRRSTILFVFLFTSILLLAGNAPDRARGISIHLLPKRVADLSGKPWGLTVDYASYLKAESKPPALQSPAEFLEYVRKQDATVQENGVWIVTTHPDAYSEPELKLLEDIKSVSHKEHIVLFVCRGSELPNGWKRY
jgi:hypothetical protein